VQAAVASSGAVIANRVIHATALLIGSGFHAYALKYALRPTVIVCPS
jgi:hypothetical protein